MARVTPGRSPANAEELVVAGKFTTVHGVKGWLKVHSYTVPEENIFTYQPWWMQFPDGWKQLEVDHYQSINKGFIAHLKGLDDRDEARTYCQRDILVPADAFPPPGEGEIYWHQLQGLKVVTVYEGRDLFLGTVSGMLETGANDVIVVQPQADSHDAIERLIPYVDPFVVEVDLEAGVLTVDWDPEFETRAD